MFFKDNIFAVIKHIGVFVGRIGLGIANYTRRLKILLDFKLTAILGFAAFCFDLCIKIIHNQGKYFGIHAG